MLATSSDAPPRGDGWQHEVKWDGVRAIVDIHDGQVHVTTRSGQDISARLPEITESHLRDFDDLLLDGELVALRDGRPDFRAVMQRVAPGGGPWSRGGVAGEAQALPVTLMLFDVMRAAGTDVTKLPLRSRRELLTSAGLGSGSVLVPAAYDDADAIWAATRADGIEGVVSKRMDSPYREGVRSDEWLKAVHRRSDTFVVIGWRPITGTTGTVGALLIAEPTPDGLVYRGRVGTGLAGGAGKQLLEWLTPAPKCPLATSELAPEDIPGTHWVRPDIMVEVAFLERSSGGRLRAPSYKGLRLDLPAKGSGEIDG